jgi:hypothetical protein
MVHVGSNEVYEIGATFTQNLAHCAASESNCQRSCAVADETHWDCTYITVDASSPNHQNWTQTYTANGDWYRYKSNLPIGFERFDGMSCQSKSLLSKIAAFYYRLNNPQVR